MLWRFCSAEALCPVRTSGLRSDFSAAEVNEHLDLQADSSIRRGVRWKSAENGLLGRIRISVETVLAKRQTDFGFSPRHILPPAGRVWAPQPLSSREHEILMDEAGQNGNLVGCITSVSERANASVGLLLPKLYVNVLE